MCMGDKDRSEISRIVAPPAKLKSMIFLMEDYYGRKVLPMVS